MPLLLLIKQKLVGIRTNQFIAQLFIRALFLNVETNKSNLPLP